MFRRDGLLGFALCYVVRLGGDERDELDAAVYEQISGISRESNAGLGIGGGENFCDDFLHSCCTEEMVLAKDQSGLRAVPGHGGTLELHRCSPFGKERSSLPRDLSAIMSVDQEEGTPNHQTLCQTCCVLAMSP